MITTQVAIFSPGWRNEAAVVSGTLRWTQAAEVALGERHQPDPGSGNHMAAPLYNTKVINALMQLDVDDQTTTSNYSDLY